MLQDKKQTSDQLENALRNIFRVGTVTSTFPASGRVRVVFPDVDNMISYDLQVLFCKTLNDREYGLPDAGTTVLCLFLGNGPSAGFVLGAVYSEADSPPHDSQDKPWHWTFGDGTVLEYDRAAHKLLADVKGDVDIKASGSVDLTAEGNVVVTAPSSVFNVPTMEMNGNFTSGGTGGQINTFNGNVTVNGNLTVNGDSSVTGNSYALTRSGGTP